MRRRPSGPIALLLLLACALPLTTACRELQSLREVKEIQDQRIGELTRLLEKRTIEYNLLEKQNRESERQIESLNENVKQRNDDTGRLSRDLEDANKQIARLTAELAATSQSLAQAQAGLTEKSNLAQSLAQEASKRQAELLKNQETLKAKESALAEKETEAAKLKKDIEQATKNAESLEQNKKDLAARVEQLQSAADKAKAERDQTVADLKKETDALKEKIKNQESGGAASDAELEDAYNLLKQSLKPHIDAHVATVSRDARGAVVRLAAEYLFKGGVVELNPEVHATLDQIATICAKYPKKYVEVQGHTDAQAVTNSPFQDNWALASARADKVVRYLAERASLPPNHLKGSSASQYRPAPDDGSPDARKLNRRVEIVLSNLP